MLPPHLKRAHARLLSTANRTEQQTNLLYELNLISDLLDDLNEHEIPLNEDLRKSSTFDSTTRAWGANPGRCELCGR